MLALARYTLKGPYQAAAVVGLLAVLSAFIPPVFPNAALGVAVASICMMLSSVLVGLIILTQGSVSGLKVIGVSILGITLVAWILLNAPQLGLWTGLVQWLPIILLAHTLRTSNSLALTMMVGVALGSIGIAAQYLVWTEIEREWIAIAVQRLQQVDQLDPQLIERNVQLIRLFVLAMVAMAYLLLMLIVLTARWMQARLAQSKGFAQEFQSLALGKSAAAMAVVLIGLSFWLRQTWLSSLSFMVIIAFLFQGIAVVHGKLVPTKKSGVLLGLFYTLLLIFPQVVALTSFVGVIDNWVNFRKKPENSNDINDTK